MPVQWFRNCPGKGITQSLVHRGRGGGGPQLKSANQEIVVENRADALPVRNDGVDRNVEIEDEGFRPLYRVVPDHLDCDNLQGLAWSEDEGTCSRNVVRACPRRTIVGPEGYRDG